MASSRSEGSTYEDFIRLVRQKTFVTLYVFHGDEELLIEESVDLLVDAALDVGAKDFNLDILYGSETDARSIHALASAFPLMSDRRVVIVREFEKLSNKDLLLPYIGNPSPSTVLVLVAARPDFRTKFYKTLEEAAMVVECRQLWENDIPIWIGSRVEKLGKAITPDACRLIQAYVGRSLREIQNEIDKLFIYVGDKKTIDAQDVNAVVGLTKQYNIFELQNAIGAKDASRAMEVVERMLEMGEKPLGMIIMLTRFYQKLWSIQEYVTQRMKPQEIATALKLSSKQAYRIDADIRIARALTGSGIERAFEALTEADERLKSSNGDERLVMTLLVHSLVRPVSQAIDVV